MSDMTMVSHDTLKKARQLSRTQRPFSPEESLMIETLLGGNMDLEGLMPWSSNYTFLVQVEHLEQTVQAIYKPGEGERPLWDFPGRTLHKREFLSFLLSQTLGWPNIPATVLRGGPHGVGSVQLFVEADYEAHYFTMRDDTELDDTFKAVALFDLIANNADRKAGHCLQGKDGTIWAIDHGLTFHDEFKLRTVIHEVCNEVIPSALAQDLHHLHTLLTDSDEFVELLEPFISPRETTALKERVQMLITRGRYPRLSPYNVPYPPV